MTAFIDILLNPIVISILAEVAVIGVVAFREFRAWYKKALGKIFIAHMCIKEDGSYRETAALNVDIKKEMFRFDKHKYTRDLKKSFYKTPFNLLYEIGNTLPIAPEDFKLKEGVAYVNAEAVDDITDKKVVEQALRAAKPQGFEMIIPVIAFAAGAIMVYMMLYASHALKT